MVFVDYCLTRLLFGNLASGGWMVSKAENAPMKNGKSAQTNPIRRLAEPRGAPKTHDSARTNPIRVKSGRNLEARRDPKFGANEPNSVDRAIFSSFSQIQSYIEINGISGRAERTQSGRTRRRKEQ